MDGKVDLGAKLATFEETFVVPRGVEHRPRSDEGAEILLIEPLGTPNTGDSGLEAAPEVEI